ncbi:MAG: tetratricopeptide repeat protein [Anaerolineales bacterium]
MSTTNNDVLLQAYTQIKAGNLPDARTLLGKFIRNNPNSERAWLLMSLAVAEPAQQRDCLQRVLLINPFNADAQSRLAQLNTANGSPYTNPPPALLADEAEAHTALDDLTEAPTQPVIEPVAEAVAPPLPAPSSPEPRATPRQRIFSNWLIPAIVLIWAAIFTVLLGLGAYSLWGTPATPTPPAATATPLATGVAPLTPLQAPTLPPEWTATPMPRATNSPTVIPSATNVPPTPTATVRR